MAMSLDAFQKAEIATCLLSGVSSIGSRLSRTILSVLFSIRFGILLTGCRTIWLDEKNDFACNSTRLLCVPSCFDEFLPISSFNFFALHIMALFAHSLCVACFTDSAFRARESWLHDQLRKKEVQFNFHIIGLISRILIEGLFLLTYYKVSEGFVRRSIFHCHSTLCEKYVLCTNVNSTVKNIFGLCICAGSAISTMICLWELLACLPFTQHINSPSATQVPSKKQHF